MSGNYIERYGRRPLIGIYSDHPELITDSDNLWTIQHLGPLNPEFVALVKADSMNLVRHMARCHDRQIDKEFGHVLYMFSPEAIDLSYISSWIDLDHTTFIESNYKFGVYRRDTNYSVKTINLTEHPDSCTLLIRTGCEKIGVIFIDCWPIDFTWQHSDKNFNFYQNMINVLKKFNIDSYVFHTSFLNLDVVTPDVVNYVHNFVSNLRPTGDQYLATKHLLDFSGTERLTPELNDILFNKKSVLIPTLDGFEYWAQTTDITHWIVVGMHWNICLHHRNLGFLNLQKLKTQNPLLNFYSIPQCSVRWVTNGQGHSTNRIARLCEKSDYDNDIIDWLYTGNIAKMK